MKIRVITFIILFIAGMILAALGIAAAWLIFVLLAEVAIWIIQMLRTGGES